MSKATQKQDKTAFPPVAGRPGFVAVDWTRDGAHVIKTGGKALASYKGTTRPQPDSEAAIDEYWALAKYTLPSGKVVTGLHAVGAMYVAHDQERVRGAERSRLAGSDKRAPGKPDAETYQAAVNAYRHGAGLGSEPVTEEALEAATPEQQRAMLRAQGLPAAWVEAAVNAMAAKQAKNQK